MAEGHIGNLGALHYHDLIALIRLAASRADQRLRDVRRDLTGTPGFLSDRDRSLIVGMLRRLADDAIAAVATALRMAAEPVALGLAERLGGIERASVHATLSAAGVAHADSLLEAVLVRLGESRVEGGGRRFARDEYVVLRARRCDEYGNPRVPIVELPRDAAEWMIWSAAAAIRLALALDGETQPMDDVLERAAARAVQAEGPYDGAAVIEAIRRVARVSDLGTAIDDGDVVAVAVLIADAAQLPLAQVRRVLYGTDAVSLAVLGRHLGMTRESFGALAQLVSAPAETFAAFDRTQTEEATKVVREWTRSAAYRAALDRIGAARLC